MASYTPNPKLPKAPLPKSRTKLQTLDEAKAKAPTPKSNSMSAQKFADDKAKANLSNNSKTPTKSSSSNAAKVGKVAGKVVKTVGKGAYKLVGGKVGLALGAATLGASAVGGYLNKTASKGHMPSSANKGERQSSTSGRGGAAQGFIKDKPKGQNFSTASKPPINKTKSKSTNKYRVESGDTLSGIAKRAGVTLAELRAANPQIKDPRKIFRNTGVIIPKGGTKPEPGYTGPVPYRPGSKAAADYEASRKKR
jgi:LysM repeat protein